jgi:alkylation response protein AidB-like acyl-CoA dehydrogenase
MLLFMRTPTIDEFSERALQWLTDHASPAQPPRAGEFAWGEGVQRCRVPFAEFRRETPCSIGQTVDDVKAVGGYHAITAPCEYGGLGLDRAPERSPTGGSSGHRSATNRTVSRHDSSPTIQVFGSDEQKATLVGRFLAAKELCCQLFSGRTPVRIWRRFRVPRCHDGTMDRQRSEGLELGAQFSDWGELIARSDPDCPSTRD